MATLQLALITLLSQPVMDDSHRPGYFFPLEF